MKILKLYGAKSRFTVHNTYAHSINHHQTKTQNIWPVWTESLAGSQEMPTCGQEGTSTYQTLFGLQRAKNQCTTKRQSQQLIEITRDHLLEQTVTTPTRTTVYTSYILDLFFTNNPTLVSKCEVLPGIGDHDAVFIESSLRPLKFKKPTSKVRVYRRACSTSTASGQT